MHRIRTGVLALVFAVGAAACGGGGDSSTGAKGADSTTTSKSTTTTKPPPLTFYKPGGTLDSGKPGDIINKEKIALDPSLSGTGWRITYVSTTPSGYLIPVTGVIIVPPTPAPENGYEVVAWSHGTTGDGDKCAPSKYPPFDLGGAAPLLSAGKMIAATDYEGQGTDTEIHPYLVSESEAHSILDSVRAAKHFGGGDTIVTWGWSQGGQAALSARQFQQSYAPEFKLLGTAAHAPVTDLRTFLLPGRTDPGIFPFTAEAILAWSTVYDQATLTDLVNVQDAQTARLAKQACEGDIAAYNKRPLDEIFRAEPTNVPTWQEIADKNSVKVDGSDAPVLLMHGDADTTVPVAGTVALVATLCAQGVSTEFAQVPTWNHLTAYFSAVGLADQWILDRFNGVPAPSNCPAPEGSAT